MGQKLKYLQSVFNKGELSPRLRGRVDNQAYYKAYDVANNIIPFAEGACTFRPGTVFVNEVKDSAKDTILVGFRFSTVQNYIIEFGDQYVRFYRNRGIIESAPSTPYEVATPYLEADLRSLNFFQSADVLYILHPNYQTRKLIRTSDTNWSLSTVNFVDGPYYPINSTATTVSVASGVATSSTGIFASGDVGRTIRIKHSGGWRYGTITAFNSATSVNVTMNVSGDISATVDWRLSSFGGSRGWPSVGSIFEERLIVGRTLFQPSTVWGSETGDFEKFSPSNLADGVVGDDNGFAFTIGNDQVNDITWISAGRQLLLGTIGAEYSMTGGTSSGFAPITPSNVTIKRESNYGSRKDIRAVRVGNAVLFATQSAQKVREMYYEFGIDSYISRDTTLFSQHILKKGVVDMAYVQEPDPHLWTVTGDGKLIGMIYERLQEVEGWHKHQIAGLDAKVKSISVIPKPSNSVDDLWMIVERKVDGSTVKYVEYLSEIYEDVDAPIESVSSRIYAKFLDSCISYDGFYNANVTLSGTTGTGVTVTASSPVFSASDVGNQIRVGSSRAIVTAYSSGTSITVDIISDFLETSFSAGEWSMQSKDFSGLDHLEGETVGIVADGYVVEDMVVSAGQISINDFASVVHVGLKYSSNIRFLLPEFPSLGTIQGRKKSVAQIHLFLTDSYELSVKDSETGIAAPIKFLGFPLQTDQAQPLLNGLLTFHPPSGYERDSQLELIHSAPLPFTLNYIVMDLDVTA